MYYPYDVFASMSYDMPDIEHNSEFSWLRATFVAWVTPLYNVAESYILWAEQTMVCIQQEATSKMRPVGFSSIVLWATITIGIRCTYGKNFDRFNTLRIPEAKSSSILEMGNLSCANEEYHTGVGEFRRIRIDRDTSYLPELVSTFLFGWFLT